MNKTVVVTGASQGLGFCLVKEGIKRGYVVYALDIIHKSFQTVADDMNLTKENCPSHTAFMSLEKLQNQFKNGNPMFLYEYNNAIVGYFSLSLNDGIAELNNLSVLPEYKESSQFLDLYD